MKVAVWDFDGTLARRRTGWSGAVLEVLRSADPECSASVDDVRPFLQSGYPWHTPDIIRPPGLTADAWWESLTPVFSPAFEALGRVSRSDIETLVRRVREFYVDPSSWETYEDTHTALTAFRRAGWVQFVLSNHVPELPSIVDSLGLSQYFEKVWTSAATGTEKPNPLAFRCVLDSIPRDASAWMIGDSITMDVAGATAVGMNSVLVRKVEEAVTYSCESLEDVLAIIEDA